METAVLVIQIVIALGIFNVWALRFGKATGWRGGSAATMKEEFEIYSVNVTAYSLIDAKKLAEVEGACEICTPDEAIETAAQAAEATTKGWTYPVATADPFVDRSGDKEPVTPRPVVEIVETTPTKPAGPTVRVAFYADPSDSTIKLNGKAVPVSAIHIQR